MTLTQMVPDSVVAAFIVAAAILVVVTGTLQIAVVERVDHLRAFGHQPTQLMRYALIIFSVIPPILWLIFALQRFGFQMLYSTAPSVALQFTPELGWRFMAIDWSMFGMIIASAIAWLYVAKRPTYVIRRRITFPDGLRPVVVYVTMEGEYYK